MENQAFAFDVDFDSLISLTAISSSALDTMLVGVEVTNLVRRKFVEVIESLIDLTNLDDVDNILREVTI